MNRNLPYVPSRDLSAVSNLVTWPYILVAHPSLPACNAEELIAIAKARPGELNMASGGAGSGQHISGELFNIAAGTRMTHVLTRARARRSSTSWEGTPTWVSRSGRHPADQIGAAESARRLERHALRASAGGAADQRIRSAGLRVDHLVWV